MQLEAEELWARLRHQLLGAELGSAAKPSRRDTPLEPRRLSPAA